METDILTLIHKAQTGDQAACDAAVEQNLGLVWSVVKRFTRAGLRRGGFISNWLHGAD